jgi:hypothetical protein
MDRVRIGKVYINLKKGTFYRVITFAIHSETVEPLVIYGATEEAPSTKLGFFLINLGLNLVNVEKIWARPVELFKEKFQELSEFERDIDKG